MLQMVLHLEVDELCLGCGHAPARASPHAKASGTLSPAKIKGKRNAKGIQLIPSPWLLGAPSSSHV